MHIWLANALNRVLHDTKSNYFINEIIIRGNRITIFYRAKLGRFSLFSRENERNVVVKNNIQHRRLKLSRFLYIMSMGDFFFLFEIALIRVQHKIATNNQLEI